MTVKELIQMLNQMPKNATVLVINTSTDSEVDIQEVMEYEPGEVVLLGREVALLDH